MLLINREEDEENMDPDYVVVFCTAPPAESGKIARLLVEERLAACVSLSAVRSCFRWEDKISEETEDLLIIKSEGKKLEELAARIEDVHPYDVPEIIAIPIIGGDDRYLDWISESLRSTTPP